MSHPYFDLPRPTVIGHRGCAGEVPENTLESFEAGLAAGADVLESDVHLSRDGVPVLIHDADLERVTGVAGRVQDLAFEELRKLDAGHHREDYRGRGLRIPSLAEAFSRFPEARFNLELKADSPGMVEAAVERIAEAGAAARTLLTAEKPRLMERIHRHLDAAGVDAARGASAADVLAFVRAALDGSPPPSGPMALQVPEGFGGRPLVTPEFVAHAHRHGLAVHVWTIDEPADMERLLDLGVDGLVTDFPGRLATIAQRRRTDG